MNYCIGVDIGGTTIKAGVVDESYKIVKRGAVPTLAEPGADDGEKLANGIAKLLRDLCEQLGITLEDIKSIGICTPGSVNEQDGVVLYANNIDLHNVPLRKMVYDRIGKNIALGNDADVAAFGEYVAGSAAGCESALMITLGTGVGGGFVIGGKIYTGWNNRGGEFGHTVIQMDGAKCTCGRNGCLEAYASATGLIRMTKEAMQKDASSGMWELVDGDIGAVNGKTAFDAMEKGDALGQQVVDMYIRYLACGLANFINTLHPEKICMGGGISHSGDSLLVPLRAETYKNVYGAQDGLTTMIVQATLGNDAGIIGAAMLGNKQ